MSTRCQIGYYNKLPKDLKEAAKTVEILIYRHRDGYPEGTSGVLTDLAEFLPRFIRSRGIEDDKYLMAQLLVAMKVRSDRIHTEWLRQHYRDDRKLLAEALKEAEEDFKGYGIDGDRKFHVDIAYLYCIAPEGVQVFSLRDNEKLLSDEEARWILRGKIPERFREEEEN